MENASKTGVELSKLLISGAMVERRKIFEGRAKKEKIDPLFWRMGGAMMGLIKEPLTGWSPGRLENEKTSAVVPVSACEALFWESCIAAEDGEALQQGVAHGFFYWADRFFADAGLW
jgi:hypothetical protein